MMNWWVSNSRREAVASRGFFAAHKWWMLRRATQILVMTTFMLGPMAGIWIVKGNFASSELLGVLDLADPYMQLQGLVAGWPLAAPALIGAGIITLFYLAGWNAQVFEFAHLYLWQALIMLDVLVVWLLWMRWVARTEPARINDDGPGAPAHAA